MSLRQIEITEKRVEKYYHENRHLMTEEEQRAFKIVFGYLCKDICEEIEKELKKGE
jgi:hypothetical protein